MARYFVESPQLQRGLAIPRIARLIANRQAPGWYDYISARTSHLDQIVRSSVQTGMQQLVILGAGYDSRAYRLRAELRNARVFELDARQTQEQKRAQLARAGTSETGTTFVPIDFNRDSLIDVLAAASFDPALCTLFLWEGVSMYLAHDAVVSVLGFVARSCHGPASIAFDYMDKAVIDGDLSSFGARQTVLSPERRKEPYRFGIEVGGLLAFLRAQQLELVSDFGPDELERAYLPRRFGIIRARPWGFIRIAHARSPLVAQHALIG